jgi:hypothetical protein
MNTELLILSLLLQAISEWIQMNRDKIDALTPDEFRELANLLADERHKFMEDNFK